MAGTSRLCVLLLALVGALSLAGVEGATKYSLKTYKNSTLYAQALPYPPPFNSSLPAAHQECHAPGTCYPATNQSIAASQAVVWCGFASTHKSFYSVTSKVNLTTVLMRKKIFFECAAHNMTKMATCPVIASSICDTKTKCKLRTFGLAFYDEICLIVSNNNKNSSTYTVQMVSAYDTPRYYGVVFILVLLIVFGSWVVILFAWNIRREILRPIVTRNHPISSSNEVTKFGDNGGTTFPAPAGQSVAAKTGNWFKGLIPGKKAVALPA